MVLAGKATDWLSENLSPDAENTYLHETVHWWQTAMTGYGHSAWSLFRQSTAFVIGEWVKATDGTPHSRRIPIQALDLEAPDPNVSPASIHLHIARLSAVEMLRVAQAQFSLPNPSVFFSEVSVRPDADRLTWPVNPTVVLPDGDYILQGSDIVECQAHYLATQFSQISYGSAASALMRDGLSPKYWAAFAWFTGQVHPEYVDLFSMVCDLALQTVWSGLVTKHDDWKRESPAWRFLELTAILARREVPPIKVGDLTSRYLEYGDDLLQKAKLPSFAEVFAGAFKRAEWRKPLMNLELVMLDAMEFKRRHPWCNAYPWLHLETFDDLRSKHPAPVVQIEGRLNLFHPPSAAAAPDGPLPKDVANEISGEFLLQGLSSQILGLSPSGRVPIKGALECGFCYFDLANVCPHQIADNCPGWFYPKNGSPFPIANFGEESELGCPLEKLLYLYGVSMTDIEIAGG